MSRLERLSRWLEENDYRGYDTFDGLSARFLRPFTFDTKLLAHRAAAVGETISS